MANTKKDDDLNYCYRVVYNDGSDYIFEHFCLTPELLISVFSDGGPWTIECNNFDEMLTLFYELIELNTEKVAEIQIYNILTKEILHSKKFI